MTLALVTGASGFIGSNVVRALLDDGIDVRVLVRSQSDNRNLDGLVLDRSEGDLRDKRSLERAITGASVVFHIGAKYELSRKHSIDVLQTNVNGTRTLMEVVLKSGVDRVIHTSSVAAMGHVEENGNLIDESKWASPSTIAGPYEKSKLISERIVHDLIEHEGLPAVVVNPTAPIGPLDTRPTPTGKLILDGANGAFPAYIRSAGLNIVHVRDVAQGHILAWKKGRIGQRYILGNQNGNLSLYEIIAKSAACTNRKPPIFPIPYHLTLAYAFLDEYALSRLFRRPPYAPIAGVRLSRHRTWVNCEKALRELGIPQTPVDEAFLTAVEWFRNEQLIND